MAELPDHRPIAPSPGGAADPDDVVGRDEVAADFWRIVASTRSPLLLTEPRRMGKTATLRLMQQRCPAGWEASYHSFQGVDTVTGFASSLLDTLMRHQPLSGRVRQRLQQFVSQVGAEIEGVRFTLAPQFSAHPLAAVAGMLGAVSDALGNDHLLLMCDEVPDMVAAVAANEGDAAATRLLGLLRAWRERTDQANIAWLLTGSVGFHHVTRALGQDDLTNDTYALSLGPLDERWSRWLARCVLLGAGASPTAPVADRLGELSGGFAMLCHLVGARVRDHDRGALSGDPADVDAMVRWAFADLDATQQFTSFLTRLAPYYGDDEPLAMALLDRLAAGPADRSELMAVTGAAEERIRAVLDWLRLDHYLSIDDDVTGTAPRIYRWRYEPLRLLWSMRRR
jgi:hypothetical protein